MSIPKKLRFDVFKRDGFQCAYCGKKPPDVILEVDHIQPKSKGGVDDINNFVTACFDCNRGKRNIELTNIPAKLSENIEKLKEKELQLKEYQKTIRKIEKRLNKDIDVIAKMYNDQYPKWILLDYFKQTSLKTFLHRLPLEKVMQAMRIAINRFPYDDNKVINYFCGVCWRMINND